MKKRHLLAMFLPVFADHSSSAVLEEVVVTAQKRDQTLQEVPISVNVMSGDLIQERNYSDLEEITLYIPNVRIANNGVNPFMYIRGIGSGENVGFEQSVGTFIDGVYFGRGRRSGSQFMDLERIEVLRGPQSVFFGNSAIAGAFNLTTRKPGPEWEGYISALYETELDGKELEFATGGPLTDTLGVRFAARVSDTDGWVKNVVTSHDDARRSGHGLRATFSWEPTTKFDASLKIDYSESDIDGVPYEAFKCPPLAGIPPGLACSLKLLDPAGSTVGLNSRRSAGGESPPIFPNNSAPPSIFAKEVVESELLNLNLTMNWELEDGHVITSTTGYLDSEDYEVLDPDQTRYALASVERFEKYDQFSQELRISSPSGRALEYMAGLYYHESDLALPSDFRINVATATLDPISVTSSRSFFQDEKLISLFAQAKQNFSDSLRASLGFRYTDVEKKAKNSVVFKDIDAVSPPDPLGVFFFSTALGNTEGTTVGRVTKEKVVSEVVLEWDVADSTLLYGRYADGFKAGGFNGSYVGELNGPSFSFSPEEVKSFELGTKSTFLDGSMKLNTAVFRSEYTDLQVAVFNATTASFETINAAESVTQGLEIEANWQATSRFRVDISMSILDASYDTFSNAPCYIEQTFGLVSGCVENGQDLSGADLPFAPELSGALRLSYDYPFTNGLEVRTNLDLAYSDEYSTSLTNDPDFYPNSNTVIDLGVALVPVDDSWTVALLLKNLTDENEITAGINNPLADGTKLVTRQPPRTVSVQASYRW